MSYGEIASAMFACILLYLSTQRAFEEMWQKFFLYYGLANIPIAFGFIILAANPVPYAVSILLIHALVAFIFSSSDIFAMFNAVINKFMGK